MTTSPNPHYGFRRAAETCVSLTPVPSSSSRTSLASPADPGCHYALHMEIDLHLRRADLGVNATTGTNYALKCVPQMTAIVAMVSRITSGQQ
jgi:hypothetical protein